jgi:phage shock protein A
MGLLDRLSRVVRANLNDLVSKAEDPEKILEQAVNDMQEDLIQLRQAVARAIAEQRQTEQKSLKEQAEANKWEQRAKLALSKGDEALAREALKQKKAYSETATVLKNQLDQQTVQVDTLRRNLIALESKISEAKTKKNMLQARAKAAKANEDLQRTVSGIGTGSSMAAFERMEEKVLQMEAKSQAIGELGGMGIEAEFAKLEAGSDVEDELAMLKASMSPSTQSLPAATTASQPADPVVDAELEDLRKKINEL